MEVCVISCNDRFTRVAVQMAVIKNCFIFNDRDFSVEFKIVIIKDKISKFEEEMVESGFDDVWAQVSKVEVALM